MTARRLIALTSGALVLALAVIGIIRNSKETRRPGISTQGLLNDSTTGRRFGLVKVDTAIREISFPVRVVRDTGPVLCLIALKGYRWLEAEVALTSPAQLLDLQRASASLDWALWDSIWTGHRPQRRVMINLDTWPAHQALTAPADSLCFADIIFPGSPLFDAAVLGGAGPHECERCPSLVLERRLMIQALQTRHQNLHLMLRPGKLPKPGSDLSVSILLPPAVP